MKVKRVISVVLAMMMLFACFMISASADAIKDTTKKCTITINLAVNSTPIKDAKFTITGGDLHDPLVITTNAAGIADTNENNAPTLSQGTYHVEQKAADLGVGQATAAAAFDITLPYTDPVNLNTWKYDITVSPKVTLHTTEPSISKYVADTDTETAYGQSASIMSYTDSLAYWKVTVALPDDVKNYKYLKVTDKLDTRLSDFAVLRVVNNADNTELAEETDYTKSYSSHLFTLQFTTDCIKNKLSDNTTVDIFFTTKIDLSKDNTIGQKIGNHVILNFKNSLDSDGVKDNTPQTPDDDYNPDTDGGIDPNKTPNPGDDPGKDDPYVWTGALEFTKIKQGDADTKLDAEFMLYNADTDEPIGGVIRGNNGVYSIKGLKGGIDHPLNYYLVETKAPTGYALIGTKLPFSITGINTAIVEFTHTNAGTVNAASETFFSFAENNVVTNYIVNIPNPDLPVTGGIGVWVFAVVGLAFAVLGALFFIKSKKVSGC